MRNLQWWAPNILSEAEVFDLTCFGLPGIFGLALRLTLHEDNGNMFYYFLFIGSKQIIYFYCIYKKGPISELCLLFSLRSEKTIKSRRDYTNTYTCWLVYIYICICGHGFHIFILYIYMLSRISYYYRYIYEPF